MKRIWLLAIAALGAAALVLPVSSSAHSSTYWWSTGLCKHRLVTQDAYYKDGRYLDIVSARCLGTGRSEWSDLGTKKLYQHFVTVFQGSGGTLRCGTLHVTGDMSFQLTDIRLASICVNGG